MPRLGPDQMLLILALGILILLLTILRYGWA
jgi:hypothetical protein